MAPPNDEYNIFTHFDEYKKLQLRNQDDPKLGYTDKYFCNDIGSKFKNHQEKIIKHCKQFLFLCGEYNMLTLLRSITSSNIFGIINYRLNSDLRDIVEIDVLKSEFYPSLTNHSKKNLKGFDWIVNLYRIEDNVFNNLKVLYDLYDNFYNRIQIYSGTYQKQTCNNGCPFKIKCATLFNENIVMCPLSNKSKFCEELEKFREKYMSDSICTHCSEAPTLEPRKNDVHVERTPTGERDSNLHMKQDTQESQNSQSPIKLSVILPIILCTAVGIFLFLYLFYKFTPLGSLLSTIVLKKKIIRHNFQDEKDEESLENPYESIYINTQNNEHHISYYQMSNS
ncbi:PIR Superfamily Protein [Plasmodium ovale wallikeri]|uniref:PIR Superfamily Protein n=1 Tax=Plasmodium ovale wallikeri TaxID=864142 RepID=A0A1A9AIZ2_PLAOA|nr:PIR Superfamily Protein [Plasmodium ovale wallikeri]